jgi:anti-anti-sigma factor
MSIDVRIRTLGEATVLSVSGSIDNVGYEVLERECGELMRQGRLKIIVDLERAEYICSAGIGVIVRVFSLLESPGGNGRLLLAAARSRVKDVLSLMGLDAEGMSYPTVAAALDALGVAEPGTVSSDAGAPGASSGETSNVASGVALGFDEERLFVSIQGLPAYAFGRSKSDWLSRFMRQPFERCRGVISWAT